MKKVISLLVVMLLTVVCYSQNFDVDTVIVTDSIGHYELIKRVKSCMSNEIWNNSNVTIRSDFEDEVSYSGKIGKFYQGIYGCYFTIDTDIKVYAKENRIKVIIKLGTIYYNNPNGTIALKRQTLYEMKKAYWIRDEVYQSLVNEIDNDIKDIVSKIENNVKHKRIEEDW